MKVLLKKDFETLGNAGDIKEVKDGYARNYLIPRGIATNATASNIKSFEEVKKQQKRKTERESADAKVIASRLEANPLTITVKTSEEGKIYGSVTSQMIYDALLEKGFDKIEKRKINIPEHIKTTGEYTINVKLYTDVIAALKVNVVNEVNEDEEISEQETSEEDTVENTTAEENKEQSLEQ